MKILLQLILPIFLLIIFKLFNSGLENFSEYLIKYLYPNYLFMAAPHFITLFLSQIIKRFKPTTFYLLTVANIILALFLSFIIILKVLNFVDLSLLWIFYPIISAISIILTLFIVNSKIKFNKERRKYRMKT